MQLRTLREGSHDNDGLVLAFEEFLRGEGFYWMEVDGVFDDETSLAVRQFQKEHKLKADGVVGNNTWGRVIGRGFNVVELEDDDDFPPRPADAHPLNYNEREKVFGHIECMPAGVEGNPEAVVITNDFSKHLVREVVPQLVDIDGVPYNGRMAGRGPKSGRITLHEKAVDPMLALWDAWEAERLSGRVLTWAGMLCARYVRGSRSVLSNHAYGTAFDINAPWNGLRRVPALKGQRGYLRDLVMTAYDLGWWWGGWGWPPYYTKFDGMHFELYKV